MDQDPAQPDQAPIPPNPVETVDQDQNAFVPIPSDQDAFVPISTDQDAKLEYADEKSEFDIE